MQFLPQTYTDCAPAPPVEPDPGKWFAVQTKPRHEKRAAFDLEEKGFAVFLPLHSTVHRWSDRKREVQLPLFPTYLFVRIGEDRNERSLVLRASGVRSFVGAGANGVSISYEEIDALQRILAERLPYTDFPFLNIGQNVRICGGSLDGICGILMAINNDRSLVVSIQCIQKSIAIRINGYGVNPA